MRVSGTHGELRVGYQVAAELGSWELVLQPSLPKRYSFSGRMSAVDEYWVTQRPLRLALDVGYDQWLWLLEAPEIEGCMVRSVLDGRPQVDKRAAQQKEEQPHG